MRKVWDSLEGARFEQVDRIGLQRLMGEVDASKKKARLIRRVASYTSAVACMMALVFFAGWKIAGRQTIQTKEVTLITSEGSVGDYTLPDGSRVRLNSSSRLTYYNDFSGDIRLVSLDGEGFFEVSKNAQKPFVVEMNNLKITVLGTSFDAKSYPDDPTDRVILKTGSVAVDCPDGSHAKMVPGEVLVYNKFDGSLGRSKVDANAVCRWYESYLEFDGESLENILGNISDRYRVSIDYKAKSCSLSNRMSITITHEPLEKVLDVLCKLFPISYQIQSDNHIVIVDKK